jgi:hypothetical protein
MTRCRLRGLGRLRAIALLKENTPCSPAWALRAKSAKSAKSAYGGTLRSSSLVNLLSACPARRSLRPRVSGGGARGARAGDSRGGGGPREQWIGAPEGYAGSTLGNPDALERHTSGLYADSELCPHAER